MLKRYKIFLVAFVVPYHSLFASELRLTRIKNLNFKVSPEATKSAIYNEVPTTSEYYKFILEKYGVFTDGYSKVWSRSETEKVELSCLDCLVYTDNSALSDILEVANEEHNH